MYRGTGTAPLDVAQRVDKILSETPLIGRGLASGPGAWRHWTLLEYIGSD